MKCTICLFLETACEVAQLRAISMGEEFQVIPVDGQIAQLSAELRHKYRLSMGDSMIAATASSSRQSASQTTPISNKLKKLKPSGSKATYNKLGKKAMITEYGMT